MDVDAARLGGNLTEEEKKHLMDEGRCFYCKDQGHRANRCQRKPKRSNQKGQARATETTERTPSPTPSNATTLVNDTRSTSDQLAAQLRAMTIEERNSVFDQLLSENPDF
jgi:hypothetical protein